MKSLLLVIYFLFIALGQVGAQTSGMETKTWKVAQEFLSGNRSAYNPVKKGFQRNGKWLSLQGWISEELQLDFPEGTSMTYEPIDSEVTMIHTPEMVKAIDLYLQMNRPNAANISFLVEIYQLSALDALRIQQKASPLAEHGEARERVTNLVEEGKASIVNSFTLQSRSGQRAKHSDVLEVIYPTEFEWDGTGDSVLPMAMETRNVGTIFEVDPVVGADDWTVDLVFSLEHHTAPPIMRKADIKSLRRPADSFGEVPEFHAKRIITQITTGDGIVQLVGGWKPTGKPEYEVENLMHLAFLKTDLQETQ